MSNKDDWLLGKFFLCVSSRSIKTPKKELSQYAAILAEQAAFSIKDLFDGFKVQQTFNCSTRVEIRYRRYMMFSQRIRLACNHEKLGVLN